MNGRGLKIGNEYVAQFGKLYEQTPKAVFAAVALSLAFIKVEERGFDLAVQEFLNEWRALYENGLVPQKPPKGQAGSPDGETASNI
jgi:hypothetical protein